MQVSASQPGPPWSKTVLPLDDAFQEPSPPLSDPLPTLQSVSLFALWLQEVQRDPRAELTSGQKESPSASSDRAFFNISTQPASAPLPGPFVGPVLFCHRPLMSFTTRQFSDPVTLFVMLYFTAASSGKWVLYPGRAVQTVGLG